MTNFRENIIDILDEWGFYPIKDPCSGSPAYNSGHVQLKCYINNVCPFYKTPYKEDTLVFNTQTFRELEDYLPGNVVGNLMTTPGVEGMHFKPRKVFRHNYISKWENNKDSENYDPNASIDDIFKNFETYYQDISANGSVAVKGADRTRYKAEHDWAIAPSFFDRVSCGGGDVEECGTKAQWSYFPQEMADNRMTDADVMYDYQYEYWLEHMNSFEWSDETNEWKRKSGEDKRIDKYTIQMPMQTRTHDDDASGIHWHVIKRTPIFQGADFFVRFYKLAQKPVSYSDSIGNVPFKDSFYSPLDYTRNDKILVDPSGGGFSKYANDAFRPADEKNKDVNTYDFYTQAYYMIEMQREYFIVIPARGSPTFVHFFKGENSNGVVAKKLGKPFGGISGAQLIDAEYFDVIVRNHLGRLVIQFEGKGFNDVEPWIIERKDWVPQKVPQGETSYMTEEIRDMVVPRGRISLRGGNIRCGFLFGLLQYETNFVSFIYPPRDTDDGNATETMYKAFENISPEEIGFSSEYFQSNPLWLPMNGKDDGKNTSHHLVFESYSGQKLETGSVGNQSTKYHNKPLFTQDAQYYKNYSDKKDPGWEPGYFYYNDPIKEFSPGGVKTSNIIIQKHKYLNYASARHQGFDTYIGMMCGDHLFDEDYYAHARESADPYPMQPVNYINTVAIANSFADSKWYIPDCKTPILSSIRLKSDASPDPRWDDGTSIKSGTNRDPEIGSSRYFVDASDHVMTFSHSWTTSGLVSIEHSGTVQFYLNHDMNVQNNVTSNLIALQDKTFYIEIWVGYGEGEEASIRDRTTGRREDCSNSNYTKIPGFYKMFTGLCQGGSISYEYGKHVMTCQVNDYSVVLKGMKFVNSPWFDAMKDVVAIKEIVSMAGFRDQGVYDPGRLIAELAENAISLNSQQFHNHFDGRTFKYEPFGLPSGYNRLNQPSFKFNDGDPFTDAIEKISKYSSKLFYFDEYGIAHYEDYQDLVEKDFLGTLNLNPLYEFTTNPEKYGGQLVFNKVDRAFNVTDIVSHLKTITNTPDRHLLVRDRYKWEIIENPEASGFLGFQKTFYQIESMFGSKEAQISAMNKYAAFFKPIVQVKFETYGLPLRSTDIVSLDGEVLRVTKVDHVMDAQKNQWWMTVDCERYQAIDASDIIPFDTPD